ncbi:filamentous hemagglutinin N-terminal domain-containing protein, partial [Metallibacterium sp.]|uniref:beta strand repeat-containing protein n=1 Tax=Metallibacterium sp. TaxID=2940281 RepID=UPI0031F32C89
MIVGGSGSISQSGDTTTINQSSGLLAINWNTFNVGANATVLFNQPSAAAIALNRILDQNPSLIFGHIDSNGLIFLINTHGIIFGPTAELNVGGLLASTLDMTPTDFMSRRFNLDAHGAVASVVNYGLINAASGGSVSLLGGQVTNNGLIVANYGHINLDGANRAVLDFGDNGLINIQVTGELKKQLDAEQAAVINNGTLRADSGTVILQATAARNLFTNLVNNTGNIIASGISSNGGVVRLVAAGGNTLDSGTIDASGMHGGTVQILSDQNVGVTGTINASGTQGGGSIRVGGGWHGGEGLPTAAVTYVGPTATLDANATQSGNGGSVVVWGNQGNNFYGTITADGGAQGGNGGQVETSAHTGLNVQGNVDASAVAGLAGTWLLDPWNVTIATGGTAFSNPFSATATSTIDPTGIDTALTGGTSVVVFTGSSGTQNGDIVVNSPITASGAGSLYLKAAGSIFLNANISSSNSTTPLNLYLWANYGGTTSGSTYSSNATCTSSTACVVDIGDTGNASIATGGGSVDVETGAGGGALNIGSTGITGSINTGSGALTVNTTGIVQSVSVGNSILAGAATFNAGAGVLTLGNAGNDFTGAVSLNNSGAYAVTLNNGGNALTLGSSSVGSGTLTVGGTGITQGTGTSITQAAGAGAATFNAGAGALTLGNAGNDFTGAVSLNNSGPNDVTLNNGSNALTLGSSSVGSGTLTVSGTGITQAAGTSITQAAGAGAATFNAGAGALTLGNTGNDFQGTVSATGAGVSLADANNLNVLALTDNNNGNVNLTAGGTLTLPASGINAGTGNLTLASDGGALTSSGTLSGSNVSLSGSTGLVLNGNVSATGTLTLTSNATIDQTGGILTANTLTGSAAGSVTLNEANLIGNLG